MALGTRRTPMRDSKSVILKSWSPDLDITQMEIPEVTIRISISNSRKSELLVKYAVLLENFYMLIKQLRRGILSSSPTFLLLRVKLVFRSLKSFIMNGGLSNVASAKRLTVKCQLKLSDYGWLNISPLL